MFRYVRIQFIVLFIIRSGLTRIPLGDERGYKNTKRQTINVKIKCSQSSTNMIVCNKLATVSRVA